MVLFFADWDGGRKLSTHSIGRSSCVLTYPEAHSNRGGVLIDLGRPEEALEAFNRAMIARRGFVDALLGRGIALDHT